MASTINAITTGAGGIVTTGDSSGNISLQSNGTTVLATTSTGVAVTGTLTANGVTVGAGGATTTSSAVDITLTSTSNRLQDVTMTAADKSVILPDATTLSLGGPTFIVNNRGGRDFYIKNNSGVIIAVVKPLASVQLSLNANATANGTWSKQDGDIFFGQYVPSQVTTDQPYLYSNSAYPTGLSTFSINNQGYVSVKKISSTTALILWAAPIDTTNSGLTNLKAVVATISAGSITYGTAVTVYTGTTTGLTNFGAVVLSSTAALVLVEKNTTTASVVYPLVLSGNSITVGTASATFGITTGNSSSRIGDICYLSATTAMISYVSTNNTALSARVVTHNGSSAPTLSTAVALTADASYINRLIPLTSTTCQWLYQTGANGYGPLKTLVITSNGSSSAPTLGTAITTSLTAALATPSAALYGILCYPYSATETACLVNNNLQMSFTISGTTITEQSFNNLRYSNKAWTATSAVIGSIAWFTSTQGAFLRTNSVPYDAISSIVPVTYTAGVGLAVGDENQTIPTINGYGFGAIDQLDSTTAIAAIPYAKGIQAEVVTLL